MIIILRFNMILMIFGLGMILIAMDTSPRRTSDSSSPIFQLSTQSTTRPMLRELSLKRVEASKYHAL